MENAEFEGMCALQSLQKPILSNSKTMLLETRETDWHRPHGDSIQV